jgi:hypothetical protein
VGQPRSRQRSWTLLTFAIVVSRTGRPLERWALDLFEARARAEVVFPPDRHTTWTNDRRTVWFAGWQAAGRRGPLEPCWHLEGADLTVVAGRAWPRGDGWSGTAPVVAQLAGHLRAQPLVGGAEALAGTYVVASMAAQKPTAVATDPVGIRPLYWGRSAEVVVLSTRAAVAASVLAAATGTVPRRDALGAGWLAYAGDAIGARTGYERIALVPDGAVVEIDPMGAIHLHRPTRPVWRLHADELAAGACTALDDVHTEMTAAIQTALRDPETDGCVGLTGGKDSRLVLALLLADGRASDLEYQTIGGDDLPDVVAARQIASTFNLRHVTNPGVAERRAWRQRVDEAIRSEDLAHCASREITFRVTASVTAGTRNVGEPHLGRLPPEHTVLLSGLVGEALRTNYPDTTRMRSKEQASRFPDHLKAGSIGILDREVAAWYRAELHELLFEGATDDDSPQDVIDSFYLRQRMRRWLGGTQEIDSHDRVFPLYSLTAIRLAFGIGAENRHAEWIHYHLMRAACEPLLHLPFTNSEWPLGADGELVPPTRHQEALPPVPPPSRWSAPRPPKFRSAQREHLAKERSDDVEIMRRMFRHDPGNPAFELIDAGAAQRALDRFDALSERQRFQLYGALSAVIWLGGHEVPLPPDLAAA